MFPWDPQIIEADEESEKIVTKIDKIHTDLRQERIVLRNDRTKLVKSVFHSSKSNNEDKNDKERSGSKMYER